MMMMMIFHNLCQDCYEVDVFQYDACSIPNTWDGHPDWLVITLFGEIPTPAD